MNFYKKYKWLAPMQLFIAGLLMARILRTHTIMFAFIPWNLLLAAIPLYLSYRLNKTTDRRMPWVYLAAWLLFFPNAMYIITDIFHLRERPDVPQWYDLLILFSAAISGVIMGFLSLQNVEQFLRRNISYKLVPWAVLFFFLLCGYGIYLGRYLRWNSWDIITQPISLLLDVKQDVLHPVRNNQCWMLSGLFGVWLHVLYRYFKKFGNGGSFLIKDGLNS